MLLMLLQAMESFRSGSRALPPRRQRACAPVSRCIPVRMVAGPLVMALVLMLLQAVESFRSGSRALPPRRQRACAPVSRCIPVRMVAGPLAQVGDRVTTLLVNSPLYPVMVRKARATMKQTAESAGIDWEAEVARLRESQSELEATFARLTGQSSAEWTPQASNVAPDYYRARFHAYDQGNLCWDAALEQLVAGKGVGVRNFPAYGKEGEDHMRALHEAAIVRLGAYVPPGSTLVDLGCGTGTSSRRLAALFPQAAQVIGVDASPHFLAVASNVGATGVLAEQEQAAAARVSYQLGDIASTSLPGGSASLVSVCLVIHELPTSATEEVFREAYRLLSPGGSLAIMEMDPEAPGFARLRSNALLFSLVRSTEPFLDQYFELASGGRIEQLARSVGFSVVRREAATGRHFSMVALKPGYADHRFLPDGLYGQPDTHM